MLTCLNINSRYAYCYPFKSKGTEEMFILLSKFINDAHPKIIESDNGNEFTNNKIKQLFTNNEIEYVIFDKTFNKNAMAKVERFNKTIRDRIDSYMKINNTNKYIDVLDKIVKNYNNTVHRGINQKPIDANEFQIFKDETKKIHEVKEKIKYEFLIGDFVRIYKEKQIFEKGSKHYYSKSVYKIIDKENNQYIVQKVDDESKIKKVLPSQMIKINYQKLIEKPETRRRNKNKMDIETENYKKKEKQKRFLNKEGLN